MRYYYSASTLLLMWKHVHFFLIMRKTCPQCERIGDSASFTPQCGDLKNPSVAGSSSTFTC